MAQTYENAMKALRAADAAGNTEDAKRLAVIARRLQSTPTPTPTVTPTPEQQGPPPDLGGAMPFVNKAISEALIFVPEGLAQGVSLIPGVNIADKPREYIRKGFEAMGAPPVKKGRRPRTTGEFIGQGVGEMAVMLTPAGITTKLVGKGSGLVARLARDIYKTMGKQPILTMMGEAGAGLGAGTGRGLAASETTSPGIRAGAEMLGGVMGGAIGTGGGIGTGLKLGKTLFRKLSSGLTPAGQKYRVGKHLKSLVIDPSGAASKIGADLPGDLPPAVKTGERRMIDLYKKVSSLDPVKEADAVDAVGKSIAKLEKEMRKFGYGSPEILVDITKKRISAIETKIDKRMLGALESAQKKLLDIPAAKRYSRESIIVRNELVSSMEKDKSAVRQLWDDVPKNLEVGFVKTREKYTDLLADLSQAQFGDVPSVLKKNSIINNPKMENTSLLEMQGLRSKLLESSRIARKNNQWNRARIADEMSDAILNDLGIAAKSDLSPQTKSLEVALAGTRQLKTKYESGIVGKILGHDRTGAPTIAPELTLDMSIGRMGEKGAIDLNKVVVSPKAKAATEKYLARSFSDYSLDKKGFLDVPKAERWIRTNEAILDQFPALRTQLTDANAAQNIAQRTNAIMVQRKKDLRSPAISASERFVQNPDQVIKETMKSSRGASLAKGYVQQAKNDPTGEAIQGFRGGYLDYMFDKARMGQFNELGEQTLSGKTLQGLIKGHSKVLEEVFTPEQFNRMKVIASQFAKTDIFHGAKAGVPDLYMKDYVSETMSTFARVAGARIGGKIGKESAGGSLQTAQITSGKFTQFIKWLTRDKVEELVKDAITSPDPKLLQVLLMPMDKPTPQKIRFINKRMNVWLAGHGKRVWEDIKQDMEEEEKN